MKKFIHLTDLHLSSNESLNKHNNFNSQKTLKKLIREYLNRQIKETIKRILKDYNKKKKKKSLEKLKKSLIKI